MSLLLWYITSEDYMAAVYAWFTASWNRRRLSKCLLASFSKYVSLDVYSKRDGLFNFPGLVGWVFPRAKHFFLCKVKR